MSSLKILLQSMIAEQGPISIGTFMALCLGHPQFGYYMTRDPFGANGDFTTAPEISQLFGEMLAVWVMTQAQAMPATDGLQLVELGPGRGTLMHDLWRGLSPMPELRDKLQIHLVEFSPVLQQLQREKLAGLPVTWYQNFADVPQRPSFVIANEFFDALPIEQAVYHNGHWHQRLVTSDEDDFLFTLGPPLQGIFVDTPENGAIFEYAPSIAEMLDELCYFLRKNSGALAVLDYGDVVPLAQRTGETLQALYKHAPCPPLDHVGVCDLTAHVSFAALQQIAIESGCETVCKTQRAFLTELGIRLRGEKLLAQATLEQARSIKSGLERLVAPEQMGDLFRVLTVSSF